MNRCTKSSVGDSNVEKQQSRLANNLKPLVFASRVTGHNFFCHVGGRKMIPMHTYRLIIVAFFVLCFLHELPSIKFWVSNLRGIHSMLAYVETRYRWVVLFGNFALNVANSGRITRTIDHLSKLPLSINESDLCRIRRFSWFILFFNITFIVCYMVIGHEEMWINVNYTRFTSLIYIITEFYIAFANVQFVGFLYAIQKYFATINENLRNVSVDGERNPATFFIVVDGRKKDRGHHDVVRLRELHLSLNEISLRLNECYTIQILLFIVLCMIEITYSLRSGLVLIVSSRERPDTSELTRKPWQEFVLTIIWGGYYFVCLLELLAYCDFAANESRQTSVVVHELINQSQDKKLERQLQLFSLQLMNHSITFTAGRFFQLDFALLHSIIGAVTTYLVIIITFRE